MRPMIEYIKNNFQGPLIGAEIGVAGGHTSAYILRTLDMKEFYLIDIWEKYIVNGRLEERYFDLYDRVVKRFEKDKNVTIRKKLSVDAALDFDFNYLDFVYIDGNHSYTSVKQDIYAWLPKVKKGGVLGGHDYSGGWQSVVTAVDDARAELKGQLVKFEWHREYPDWWFVLG